MMSPYCRNTPPSETLRHFCGSPFGSPNRCISDFANAPFKFLAPFRTSHMPRTLGDILAKKIGESVWGQIYI